MLCKKEFTPENPKVHHHDHQTGQYIGPACNKCNLCYLKLPTFIPVVFHNLTGYDSHLFITTLGSDGSDIEIVPQNEEKYITIRTPINQTMTIMSHPQKAK